MHMGTQLDERRRGAAPSTIATFAAAAAAEEAVPAPTEEAATAAGADEAAEPAKRASRGRESAAPASSSAASARTADVSAPGESPKTSSRRARADSAARGRTYTSAYDPSYDMAKDHVAAGLLAIFLGMFGVHKFYLGYNNAGFIMLAVTVIGGIVTLTMASLIVWVIAIVEGFIYLLQSQTEFERTYVVSHREWL